MCQELDIYHVIESHNFSAQSSTTSKPQNLDPNLSILTLTISDARSCSNTGKSSDCDRGASPPAPITDKAVLCTWETSRHEFAKNKHRA